MSDLSQIKGINARQIKLLQENGVSTAEAKPSIRSVSGLKWIAEKIKANEKVKPPIPKIREPVSGEKLRFKNALYRLQILGRSNP